MWLVHTRDDSERDYSPCLQWTNTNTTKKFKMPKDTIRRTTTRRKKDPNAPKRPITAYMFYAQDERKVVNRERPDAKFGEVGKLIGEKWRQLSADDKKKYEDLAAKDKQRYDAEKTAYKEKTEAAA